MRRSLLHSPLLYGYLLNAGERLDATSFTKYRQEDGLIILDSIPDQTVIDCLQSPITLMSSDTLHGHDIRECGKITLMEAIRKMSLLPTQRLESVFSLQMKTKDRICLYATIDLH
ncbi:unnamed protein product, partial [Rotaria sp. Silwood2]